MKPVLFDLYCKAGGATKGYQRVGFHVVGVDIEPQPNYCGDQFLQGDALDVLRGLLQRGTSTTGWRLEDIAAFHASPPCQLHSSITAVSGADHPELVAPTRDLLVQTGRPYVIENVPRAPLVDPVTICGAAYCPTITEDGRRFYLRRHRLFECSFPTMVSPCGCSRQRGKVLGVYGGGTRHGERANPAGGGNTAKASKAQAEALMGIDWMTRGELCQAIPPVYTEQIGSYLLADVEARAVAAG